MNTGAARAPPVSEVLAAPPCCRDALPPRPAPRVATPRWLPRFAWRRMRVALPANLSCAISTGDIGCAAVAGPLLTCNPIRTIKSNSQFQCLAIQMSQTFFVKNSEGKSVQVQLDAGLTVRQVKDQLAAEQNVSPDQIRLVFGGKELQDSNKVSDYNVGPGSNVNMVLRMQPAD